MTSDEVRLAISERDEGSVRVITLTNPPVNALSRDVRTQLIDALDRAEHAPGVTAVVIGCNGTGFSAGADLSEFDNGEGLAEPNLHLTISTFLDEMRTPVIAAVSRFAYGGGLELVLACHYRLFERSAQIGLPEITLGFMPGAGGTQRLPRALGIDRGLTAILSGAHVAIEEYADTELVDGIVDADVVAAAIDFARTTTAPKRLRDVTYDVTASQGVIATVRQLLTRKGQLDPARDAILTVVESGLADFDAGLRRELQEFSLLAGSMPARASRHLFFAERAAKRLSGTAHALPKSVAVIGAGTMGRGIATALLSTGIAVTLVDTFAPAIEAATEAVTANLRRMAARQGFDVDEAKGRLTTLTSIDALPTVDMVIEAVIEDLDAKIAVFEALDRVLPAQTVLATNTSGLDVDLIAQSVSHPERVLGMHFFSPAHVMGLVEVVQGAVTDPVVLEGVRALTRHLRKIPVVARVAPGFIGNRIFNTYMREANILLLEGATVQSIDAAMQAWGFRMGPFGVMDLIGQDLLAGARSGAGIGQDPEWEAARRLVEHGAMGTKSGQGWYSYADPKRPTPNPLVAELLTAAREAHGVVARTITPSEIVEKLTLVMTNEAAAALREGVASSAGDIDVVFTQGYGYPREHGGPAFTGDEAGLRNVARILRRYAAVDSTIADPARWTPDPLLVSLAQSDDALADWSARS